MICEACQWYLKFKYKSKMNPEKYCVVADKVFKLKHDVVECNQFIQAKIQYNVQLKDDIGTGVGGAITYE